MKIIIGRLEEGRITVAMMVSSITGSLDDVAALFGLSLASGYRYDTVLFGLLDSPFRVLTRLFINGLSAMSGKGEGAPSCLTPGMYP
jgi:hypothetical protein